jgi:DNA polymerase III delta subunit
MIYLYSGENDFAIAEKVRLVSSAFKKRYSDASLERIDGSEIAPADLAAKLTSIDMFTPRKLLVLTNIGKKKTNWDTLAQSLPLVADSTEIVIIEPKPDGRLTTTKEIKKLATQTEFKALKPYELEQWTKKTAQELKLEVKGDAVKLLAEFCEYNQWEILHALEKLVHVTKVITTDVVKKYIQPNLEADIFTVLELAINQNLDELGVAIARLSQKEDINKFMGLLASQVFTLAAIKNSSNDSEIARDFGLAPFLVTKSKSLANKVSDDKLKELVAKLAEIDGRVKLGEDGWLLIKLTFNQLFH